jgi:thiamine-phosphate pyrophosphorylase
MRGLYAIADVKTLATRGVDVVAFVRAVAEARPAAIQLRAKLLPAREMLALLRLLSPICRRAGVPLVANDRVDVAALAGCDCVHIGQDDLPFEIVHRLAPRLDVGVSTHDLEQLARALAHRPAYVAYGPVFPTASKDAPDPVVGLAGLRAAHAVARAAGIPLVAIGGITLERAETVAASADAAAVIAALLPPEGPVDLEEVTARAHRLHAALGGEGRGDRAPGSAAVRE